MSTRYYLSDVIVIDGPLGPAYAAAPAAILGVNHIAIIPSKPDGTPLYPWCLVAVATADHAAVMADRRNDPLPDVGLDIRFTAISGSAGTVMRNALSRRSINSDALTVGMKPDDGYREIINRIGRFLDPIFSVDRFEPRE